MKKTIVSRLHGFDVHFLIFIHNSMFDAGCWTFILILSYHAARTPLMEDKHSDRDGDGYNA